jgi:membrane associated rhomboid family serine protease
VTPGAGFSGLGFLDILFNLWALVFVGPALENLLGHSRFLGLYLLSALGGSVFYYWIAAPSAAAAGASGAIFGLFGAWFVVSKRLRLDTRGIIILIAINLAFSFIYRSTIAWQDHIGGLVTGALITAAFVYAPRKNRTAIQIGAAVVVLAILVLATALRSHQILTSV